MEQPLDVGPSLLWKVLELVPEFVIALDRDSIVRYINRVEPGYERELVIGMKALAIIAPDSHAVFTEAFAAVLDTGEEREYEVETTAPDGTAHWYRSRMSPVVQDGKIAGVVLLASNVTELRAAQARAAQLGRLLPLCAWCGKIRSTEGTWETIESYLDRELDRKVSHALCDECFQRQMTDLKRQVGPE